VPKFSNRAYEILRCCYNGLLVTVKIIIYIFFLFSGQTESLRPCDMAKGRKLTTSRSERFLGSYGYGYGNGQGSNGTEGSELEEEDVWSMVENNNNGVVVSGGGGSEDHVTNSQGEWSPRARGRRRIPRDDRQVGGLSLAFDPNDRSLAENTTTTTASSSRVVHQFRGNDGVSSSTRGGGRQQQMATSAPVNVPDWSKILRVDSVESLHESDEDDGDSEMVPPHEYLAREYARSQKMAATSVFEGVGRTLKGRDMRRVRDAVWSQTGFYG
jgi:hypothetical protein